MAPRPIQKDSDQFTLGKGSIGYTTIFVGLGWFESKILASLDRSLQRLAHSVWGTTVLLLYSIPLPRWAQLATRN